LGINQLHDVEEFKNSTFFPHWATGKYYGSFSLYIFINWNLNDSFFCCLFPWDTKNYSILALDFWKRWNTQSFFLFFLLWLMWITESCRNSDQLWGENPWKTTDNGQIWPDSPLIEVKKRKTSLEVSNLELAESFF
jgi:hypothetical protein